MPKLTKRFVESITPDSKKDLKYFSDPQSKFFSVADFTDYSKALADYKTKLKETLD